MLRIRYDFGNFMKTFELASAARKFALILRCSIFGLILSVGACGNENHAGKTSSGVTSEAKSRTLRRGLPGEPKTLDPHLADDTYSLQVVRDLYEGLTALNRDGSVVAGIAGSWSVDETGTRYTFSIRPGAKWSNGDPITAYEFVAGLQLAVSPKSSSGSASMLSVIQNAEDIIAGKKPVSALGVTAIDRSTVAVALNRPAPYILQILAEPVAAPLHLKPESSSGTADLVVTDGPYRLGKRAFGAYIELERNKEYWNADQVRIEHVRYVDFESQSTELRSYLAKDLDLTYTVPTPDLARVEISHGSELQTAPILGTLYLALDLTETPLRNNLDLRQALSMAVDRDVIAQHLSLHVAPAYSFVANGIAQYTPPAYAWGSWPRDRQIDMARELFKRAHPGPEPLHLTMYFNGGEGIERIMVSIADAWKKNLGIETALVSDEFRVFLAQKSDRKKWDVVRLGWWADYNDPSSFLEIFSANSSSNDSGYVSAEFNRLIEGARTESIPVKRMDLLQKSEATLLADYPIIPIYFYAAAHLVSPEIRGAQISPLNRTYSKHLAWAEPP